MWIPSRCPGTSWPQGPETLTLVQDTVEEMAKSMASNEAGTTQASAAELYAFLKRVWPGLSILGNPGACGHAA